MSQKLPKESDFARIFIEQIPLLDVRAPIEFHAGAFLGSQNIPLLNDEERHLVGIRYKHHGQEAAIALGYTLVDAEKRQQRIAQWQKFFSEHPHGMLYCFRGGLRSRLTQSMLSTEVGISVPRIVGGYKAMRRFLINSLEHESNRAKLIVLGGRTGSGKTPFIQTYSKMMDLEGIANHKGSAFGQEIDPQPSQIDIDHQVAIQLLRMNTGGVATPILIEDEGAKIGARRVPDSLWQHMHKSPIIILETPIEQRISQVFNDYILLKRQQLSQRLANEQTIQIHMRDDLLQSLTQIQRRLGDERFRSLNILAVTGMTEYFEQGTTDILNLLIKRMLVEYYDPMYDYQIGKKNERILFSGNEQSVREWLAAQSLV
ncbi:MAG: tRNA 2-selenouridine(34) synthase MnmH [Halothiobacillus sp.]